MAENILLYIYPKFKEVEVAPVLSILKKNYNLHTFSLFPGQIKSACGLIIQPNIKIKNIRSWEYDMLILPGGETTGPMNHHLVKLLQDFNREKLRVAAIGHGVDLLCRAGLLKGRTYTTSSMIPNFSDGIYVNKRLVEDKNLITAKSHAFTDFGLLIGDRMNCIENIDEYNFYKGIK
ncbi:DJ-1/PfpI family protein [Fictibacillus sp. BK138]|uniref:DJ-1/PfpI family protein n=1 Tax=Fictibacillus sp. BK138 TaxID=2512121 RepID=UPI0010D02715|nr:DJ-1/PfpI family protein [Fictibacillus sp. BK138]RZT23648.1 putative intracellular protease/amidase [Fictibacillus sp. BK138]